MRHRVLFERRGLEVHCSERAAHPGREVVVKAVALRGGPITMVGALDFDERDFGFVPRRLPGWTRPQLDPFTEMMVTMPSGVRLEFITDSTAIELDVMVTKFVIPGRDPRPARFDLELPGDQVLSVEASQAAMNHMDLRTREVSYTPGNPCTLEWHGLTSAVKRCRLWLAHNATVELRGLRVDNGALVEPLMYPRARWVHHGSSISHCSEAASPTGTWPAVAALQANVELINLGFGGSCHLDQFTARTMRDIRADAYSVKAGINIVNMDSMKERVFVPALHGFIDTVRDKRETAPILIISPIVCPAAEEHPGPTVPEDGRYVTVAGSPELRAGSMSLRRMRELMADVVARRRAHGDANVHYLDGLALFGPHDVADLPDWLHPNPAGYRRMGERFYARAFGSGGPFSGL